MLIEMELKEIQIVDDPSRPQVIILGEKDGKRAFPIYIGYFEAHALDIAVKGIITPRPMTHDLIYNVLDSLGLHAERILVDELRDDTFFGKLVVKDGNSEEYLIDSRPSDAIILAAKRNLPIFVDDGILREVSGNYALPDDI